MDCRCSDSTVLEEVLEAKATAIGLAILSMIPSSSGQVSRNCWSCWGDHSLREVPSRERRMSPGFRELAPKNKYGEVRDSVEAETPRVAVRVAVEEMPVELGLSFSDNEALRTVLRGSVAGTHLESL